MKGVPLERKWNRTKSDRCKNVQYAGAMLELVLTLPVFLSIFLGTFQLAQAHRTIQSSSSLSREAARMISRVCTINATLTNKLTATDPCLQSSTSQILSLNAASFQNLELIVSVYLCSSTPNCSAPACQPGNTGICTCDPCPSAVLAGRYQTPGIPVSGFASHFSTANAQSYEALNYYGALTVVEVFGHYNSNLTLLADKSAYAISVF